MALDVGSRLGVFELTGRLGEGGMGVVYRVTDTTLHLVSWAVGPAAHNMEDFQ